MKMRLIAAALCFWSAGAAAKERPPIIDMHLHASTADQYGPPPLAMCTPLVELPAWDPATPYADTFLKMFKQPGCRDPIWSPATDEGVMNDTFAAMERFNITGVLSGPPELVAAWRRKLPGRFLPGLDFNLGPAYPPERLEALHAAGGLDVLAEVTTQYQGIAPDDPRLEPYWALAERNDIPVGIHIGPGPPGTRYLDTPGYRARLHSALTLEEVLVRHPRLRVYVMHAGYPMGDDMIALMYAHPQVYVDTGVIIYTQPRADFYRYLQRMAEAGLGKRIMFGSDQMVWPGAIARSIAVIEEAPFLSAAQKRDILYNNAARFLRLAPGGSAPPRPPARDPR
jgi:uncharacterized protein